MANIPIQDLSSAASPLAGTAYVVIKDGLTDKKATITQLREIDISAFSNVPSNTPAASDLIMIGRGSSTYKVTFDKVGLVQGTIAWFYQATAPSGWTIVPSTSDLMLATQGGTVYTTAGTQQGTWQQANHTLTLNEIPSHNHRVPAGKDSSGSGGDPKYARRANDLDVNSVITTDSKGGGAGHNHGNTWRPLAAVGVLCRKVN
jgi:hypothetical protein